MSFHRPRIGFSRELYLMLARPQPADWRADTLAPSTLTLRRPAHDWTNATVRIDGKVLMQDARVRVTHTPLELYDAGPGVTNE